VPSSAAVVAIGAAAGFLSGAFGIGGGVVTTPAIRLLLGYPELVAVGTPLLVIIPTTVAGALSYRRVGLVDVRVGLLAGTAGSLAAAGGAWLSDLVGGRIVLVATAVLICYMAGEMLVRGLAGSQGRVARFHEAHPHRTGAIVGLGAITGLYSGLLGLGGGFVIVPILTHWFGYSIKRAIGTSLVAISVLSVPGAVAHYLLGHIDVRLALLLMVGVVPGALLGARATARADERWVRVAFALFLAAVGIALGANEIGLETS
jgi:hypothetical protein